MKPEKFVSLFICLVFSVLLSHGQSAFWNKINGEYHDWHHRDLTKDSIPGISLDRTYDELLKEEEGTEIIVALLDSPVDIHHPDLIDAIYTNDKEIPHNGIDDDNNGYVDDVHGWNYLGYNDYDVLYDGVYSHIITLQQHEDFANSKNNATEVSQELLNQAKEEYQLQKS